MTEAKFQTKFSRWLQYRGTPGAYELKICKGNALPFSAVQEHQELALYKVQTACICYKIPDVGIAQKPFDCMKLCNEMAFVVVYFYTPGEKEFFLIPIETWLSEKYHSKRKSLTRERAAVIGVIETFPLNSSQ